MNSYPKNRYEHLKGEGYTAPAERELIVQTGCEILNVKQLLNSQFNNPLNFNNAVVMGISEHIGSIGDAFLSSLYQSFVQRYNHGHWRNTDLGFLSGKNQTLLKNYVFQANPDLDPVGVQYAICNYLNAKTENWGLPIVFCIPPVRSYQFQKPSSSGITESEYTTLLSLLERDLRQGNETPFILFIEGLYNLSFPEAKFIFGKNFEDIYIKTIQNS